MNNDISKQEYLKRYLEGDDKEKKRKKKVKPVKSVIPRIKIVDQDISIKTIKFGTKEEIDEDESPVVAEVIDDRPVEIKSKELYESSRWKKIGEDDTEISNMKKDTSLDLHKSRKQSAKKKTLSTKKIAKSPQRHDSDSDLSPVPVSRRHDSDSDLSPMRISHRHASNSDCSPIRSQRSIKDSCTNFKNQNGSVEKSEKAVCNQSSRNILSSHQSQNSLSDSDLSPERQSRQKSSSRNVDNYDSDLSPERSHSKKSRTNTVEEIDSDLSPPRKDTYSSRRNHSPSASKDRPKKTLSGLKAGLQSATTLREETKELKKREKTQIKQLDAELSGRNADTIVRDRRTGKKVDIDAEMRITAEKEKRNSEQQQKYAEWGKGIQQTEDKKMKLSEDLYEMSKPLARYSDDKDLDDRLKAEIYDADDPMAQYIRKKKQKDAVSEYPVYKGPQPPPNRFQIPPGYRWDGVDRSNGFEKKIF